MTVDQPHPTSDWLRAERLRLGWSATDLARRVVERAEASGETITLTQQSVSNFERAGTKGIPRWVKIAKAVIEDPSAEAIDFSTLTDDQKRYLSLIEGATARQRDAAERLLSGKPVQHTSDEVTEQLDLVEIVEIDQDYGMGGSFMPDHIDQQVHHFPRAWVATITASPATSLTIARGKGDSMDPTIRDRDMVIIDRSRRKLDEQDAIWALTVGDIGMIKRLRLRGQTVVIQSDNDRVSDEEVHADEVNLVGRVVFIGRRT